MKTFLELIKEQDITPNELSILTESLQAEWTTELEEKVDAALEEFVKEYQNILYLCNRFYFFYNHVPKKCRQFHIFYKRKVVFGVRSYHQNQAYISVYFLCDL